jgi:hypothetical protein
LEFGKKKGKFQREELRVVSVSLWKAESGRNVGDTLQISLVLLFNF